MDRRAFCLGSVGFVSAKLDPAVGLSRAPIAVRLAAADEGIIELTAASAKVKLKPDVETAVLAYGGTIPGPVLRIRKGADVKVRLVNKLDQPTTLCWHGVRCPNAMDGVGGLTQPPVAPGASFDYRFTPQDSGLYWFHPHVWPQSVGQMARGLYGVLIVEEADPPKVDDDRLVVIADWSLDEKGRLKDVIADAANPGPVETLVTINARPIPDAVTVRPGARVRLRLLNACSARIALVGFEGAIATVIAIDGQPSEVFQPARATIPIGPGSRFEVLVDVPPAAKTARLVLRGENAPDQDLMVFAVKGAPLAVHPPVVKLADNPRLPTRIPLERSIRRELVIDRVPEDKSAPGGKPMPDGKTMSAWRWSLGGQSSNGYSGKPLFTVRRGGAVTLTLVNKTNEPQQMHLHGHVFRVLHDRDDGWDPYWRDSILLIPGKTKLIAFVADNPGKWAIESLMLDRQVTGLAGWFEVG